MELVSTPILAQTVDTGSVYWLQTHYQDGYREVIESGLSLEYALEKAKQYSKNGVIYGTVHVIKGNPGPIVATFINGIDVLANVDELKINNEGKLFNKNWLAKIVSGSLRDAINHHGAITPENIGSASKRVAGNLVDAFKHIKVEDFKEESIKQRIAHIEGKMKRVLEINSRLKKTRDDLLAKLEIKQ